MIKFEKPPPVEEKKKADGEVEDGDDGGEEPPAEEEDPNKVPPFDPTQFEWTISDRKPKNLPQLFYGCKGINAFIYVKDLAAQKEKVSAQNAIAQQLDDFCGKLQDPDWLDKYLY